MGYSPWGHKESDTTERLSTAHTLIEKAPNTGHSAAQHTAAPSMFPLTYKPVLQGLTAQRRGERASLPSKGDLK